MKSRLQEGAPVLEFDGVHGEEGGEEISFRLHGGELALVRIYDRDRSCDLADIATGLEDPAAGIVRFEGAAWRDRVPRDLGPARTRIGRVFSRTAWISNLDVDENITLIHRHFTKRPESEIYAEAAALAREVGLPDLPRKRPAWVSPEELERAQWVRALCGRRSLLVLEHPWQETPPSAREAFLAALEKRREQGAAVLWLVESDSELGNASIRPTARYILHPQRFEAETRKPS